MSKDQNHQLRPASEDKTNRKNVLCECLLSLEAAFRVELNDRERVLYLGELAHIPADIMIPATSDCIRFWKPGFGISFPPIADILESARRLQAADQDKLRSQEIRERDEKPTDWAAFGKRGGIGPELIAEWLKNGRDAQGGHIARLQADPKWREMAHRLGATPGLNSRVADSEVPVDPEKRVSWARRKAVDSGWAQ